MVAKSRKFAICRKIAACAPSCSSCLLSSGPDRCRVVPYAPGSQRRHRDGRWRSDGGGLRWPQSRDFDDIAQVSGSRRGMMFRTFIASRLFYRVTRVYMDVAGRSGDFFPDLEKSSTPDFGLRDVHLVAKAVRHTLDAHA